MGSGGFPIDLILFGMIAAFLVLRLRSILGRRTGFERPPEPIQRQAGQSGPSPVISARAEPSGLPSGAGVLPEPASPAAAALGRMSQVDRNFDAARFLGGAEQAFRMIVAAYAGGDRVTLRNLLADDIYRSFETAIAAREAEGQTQRSEIRAINSTTIEQASLLDTQATITVRFVSDQISETLSRELKPVAGTDAVTEITDLWTFERNLTSQDPTWRLVSARSA